MKQSNTQNNLPSIILFIGSICFLAGLLVFSLLFDSSEIYDSFRMRLMETFPLIYLLVYATLIAPIFEEFAFRYVLSKNKKPWHYRLMSLLMLIYLPIIFARWYLVVFLLPVVILAFYPVRAAKSLIGVLLAVVFALCHLNGLDSLVINLFVIYFGVALVLSYIIDRYGIWRAILAHAAYNAIVLIPTFSLFFSDLFRNPIHIKNEQVEATIDFKASSIVLVSFSDFSDKHVIIAENVSIHAIAESLLPKRDYLIINALNPLRKVDITIKTKTDASKELLDILIQNQLISVDTTHQRGIYYEVRPQANCQCEDAKYQIPSTLKELSNEYVPINDISQFIYTHYSKVVIIKPDISLKCYRYKVNFNNLGLLSFNQLKKKLSQDYCLNLVKIEGEYREIRLSEVSS